ncbi:hypothetical protein HHK36_018245 [Tetracentron sinense]|uniref:DNA-binding protein S1FA n=1 Tax=Tetracentron sinense TaxID=13715 RepID=A0A834Z3J2_TETSI|nr:hypothetical protein HHK36_018245 [Tetracentron sinense]
MTQLSITYEATVHHIPSVEKTKLKPDGRPGHLGLQHLACSPSSKEISKSKGNKSMAFSSGIEKRVGLEQGNAMKDAETKGFNPGLIVLLVIGGLLLIFLVGNYVLYMYAQKTLPPRKKKPVSKKKMKKERLKQGVSAPGE